MEAISTEIMKAIMTDMNTNEGNIDIREYS